MKMLRTSSRVGCGFKLFGRKKRISHIFINSFTILFLIHSKKVNEVFAAVFFVKTISNAIMHIKFGKLIPIRGSLFIPLSAKIANSHQLINNRDHSDHNYFFVMLQCLLSSYIQAWSYCWEVG